MKCNICKEKCEKIFKAKILNKYNVSYFFCKNCGFLQTEPSFWLEESYKEFNKFFDSELVYTSYDPAVECALEFNKLHNKINSDYIAINLRKFPLEYSKDNDSKNIDDNLKNLIVEVEKKFKNKEIRLVPMHYFHIGGDDRMFLNKISLELGSNNIKV